MKIWYDKLTEEELEQLDKAVINARQDYSSLKDFSVDAIYTVLKHVLNKKRFNVYLKSKENEPNKDLKPPRFYNMSEGVDPDKYSDKVVKEKENYLQEMNPSLKNVEIKYLTGNIVPIIPKLKVKFKKLYPDAVIPSYATKGSAGMDLTANEVSMRDDVIWTCRTGLAVEIPEGYVGLIFPRSSIYKTELSLTNCVGVCDSDFRGEIEFKFRASNGWESKGYQAGDRVGQMIILPYPTIEPVEVDELSDSERGTGGFGSTGK